MRLGNTLSVFFRLDDVPMLLGTGAGCGTAATDDNGDGGGNDVARRTRLQLDRTRSLEAAATEDKDWKRIHVQIEVTLNPVATHTLGDDELVANVLEDASWENSAWENEHVYMFEKWGVDFMFGDMAGAGWVGDATGHRYMPLQDGHLLTCCPPNPPLRLCVLISSGERRLPTRADSWFRSVRCSVSTRETESWISFARLQWPLRCGRRVFQ